MRSLKIFTTFFFIYSFLNAQVQPPIKVYIPADYEAENQNWSISQSKDKNIYVANNKGLLEFNGAKWTLYESPNETIIRSVNVINDLIYTGCNSEFGYWQRNKLGNLYYTSLSKSLNIKFLDDEDFWNIINIDDYILFQSLKRIYIYNAKEASYNIIESDDIIYKMFKVDDSIYFQKTEDGLYKIVNGEPKLISDNTILKNNRLVNVFSREGELLIETENNGFYILTGNTLNKWDIEANTILSEVSVFRSIKLKDNSFILGTRSNGIMHMTSDGKIDFNLDLTLGLSNNTVHCVFEDSENNIWLALENGINCINIKSPFSIYTDEKGKIGTVYTSAIFNGNLYLGTNQGLFFKPVHSKDEFKIVKGIQQAVWCLVTIDNTLFCGHDTGTSIIKNDTSEKVKGTHDGTWDIKPIDNNLLLQGNYHGLYILHKNNGIWSVKNKIEGFNLSSRFFEYYNDYVFVNHEYKGVFKIQVNEDFTKALGVIKDETIGKGLKSSIIKYNNQLLYTYKEGVFKYNVSKDKFIKDTILSALFKKEDYTSGRLIFNKVTNTLWHFSRYNLSYIVPGKLSSKPEINRVSLSGLLPKGLTGYENISYVSDKKYVIGTSTGYIHIDLEKLKRNTHTISINAIEKHSIHTLPEIIDKTEAGIFKNKDNNVQFTYSVAKFEKYLDTQYQYQLEGMYPNWSNWTANSSVRFKNLPYGNYVFNVRAKVGNTLTSNTASYRFEIEKPWYVTNLLIAAYIIVFILLSLLMHNLYKRYYNRQRERLLQKAKRDLELKELENKQQLMRFNNEKLRQDIDNKNRELGISTMSLIKKNEFLNSIKKELQNAEHNKSLKHVIRIIDKNLNNADDWHLFEEAFNNADKDFLKRIKTLHPTLTSNDLRLCAYLRLNLSSKEVAPLLNISPRSVEMKRYRLRKKMDLPHESSLTDYILEI